MHEIRQVTVQVHVFIRRRWLLWLRSRWALRFVSVDVLCNGKVIATKRLLELLD